MKAAHSFKLVRITWEDSARPIPQWQWVDDYQIPEAVEYVSVGYLIPGTKKAVALAPNLGDLKHDRQQASGIIRIPRRSIFKDGGVARLRLLARLDVRLHRCRKLTNLFRREGARRL